MRKYSKLFIFLALAALLQGCVYPFHPHIEWADSHFAVIEGDIVAGGQTEVRLSFSSDLDYYGDFSDKTLPGKVYVEQEDGPVFREDHITEDGLHIVPTQNLDVNQRCRMVVETFEGTFESEWLTPIVAPQVDSLYYSISDDGSALSFFVDAGSGGDGGYYRWSVDEEWEYTSDLRAQYYYSPQDDEIYEYEDGNNLYYCWDSSHVSDIMLASTENLSEDRISRHYLYSIDKSERKISYIYSALVHQYAISEEAYRYFSNVQRNSDDLGGLFSPQPSEMRGNLTCRENSEQVVLGFISAVVPTTKRVFFYDKDFHFYRNPDIYEEIPSKPSNPWEWQMLYNSNYYVYDLELPQMADSDDPEGLGHYNWVQRRCVDCTVRGGTKVKPAYWPNDHK